MSINLAAELRNLADTIDASLPMDSLDYMTNKVKHLERDLELAHSELDRLGIPRRNEKGGLSTVYGRLSRVSGVVVD